MFFDVFYILYKIDVVLARYLKCIDKMLTVV